MLKLLDFQFTLNIALHGALSQQPDNAFCAVLL
jgi:hypothetical protein